MEYYDDFIKYWNTLLQTGEQPKELTQLFNSESAKEVHLMFLEWLSQHSEMNIKQFLSFLPLVTELIERLSKSNASHLIIMDEVNLMDEYIQKFSFDDQQVIYDFLSSNLPFSVNFLE